MSVDAWPEQLAENSEVRDASLDELRRILLAGLRAGLSGRAGSDEAFLEDVVQVTLLKIVDRLDSFEGRSKFTSWALSIALRTAYNELRRKEWKHVSLEELYKKQGSLPEEVDESPTPSDAIDSRALAVLLRTAIEKDLTPRQRDVLLCELSGMPQEEIALLLNTNRNNVYKIFHDARKALKRSLEASGHDRAYFFGDEDQPTVSR